ncbi:MAG: biosynthetic-type acetolactate synthase large subunit [Acidimicrobiales bacterium]
MRLSGAEALVKSLEMERTEVVFGLIGAATLPVYDPLVASTVRHVHVRHEQGAGHMAEGYAHVTGRPGVTIVTSGPGSTNLVTALCDAYKDSVPMVAITGQVARASIGTDAFQEADTVGITRSVTKHNQLLMSPEEIPLAVRQAFLLATTGRPGPVLLDIPKDVFQAETEWYWPTDEEVAASMPAYKPTIKASQALVDEAAKLIAAAQRPVIYAGGGVVKAGASLPLRQLAELTNAPVVTTLMARGAFPDSHPQCLGMPGMHGTYAAIMAMQEADLLVALGARFDDRVTGKLDAFAPGAKVVHVDIDPAELGKIRRPDVAIAGDCKVVTEGLVAALATGAQAQPDRSAWWARISDWQARYPLHYDPQAEGEGLKPQAVIEAIRDSSPPGTIVVAGVGQHQMWASQYWRFEEPRTWVCSGGLGSMGFGLPAAIGAKVGRPERTVWAIDGDGCFQMTAQELVTASHERIPIKVALLNNAYLGMVRQWQELFYEERYSETYLSPDVPDYLMWAKSMGCVALRVEEQDEIGPAIKEANSVNDRPVVIEFRTSWQEKVFPMVPAGQSNSEVMVHPSIRTASPGPAEPASSR